jgi:hypothetical protein
VTHTQRDEIRDVHESHRAPADTTASSRPGADQTVGRTAFDSAGDNNARLSERAAMVVADRCHFFFVRRGGPAAMLTAPRRSAAMATESVLLRPCLRQPGHRFYGELDEVRIWRASSPGADH